MKKKIVYVGMSADIIHNGHIELINFAKKYGTVIVGLLTDKAISSYKSFPLLNFNQRLSIIKNIKFVTKVIPQDTLDYSKNLKKLKPDYVAHGDDWKVGIQSKVRAKVIKLLKKWNGRLVEKKYTENISSTKIKNQLKKAGTLPDLRRSKLKRLLNEKKLLKVIECHNPISAMIGENSFYEKKGRRHEFDALWSSSLTDSVSRGMEDNQSVDYSVRISGVSDIFNVTTKPLIFDIDNGGKIEHLGNTIKKLENLGVSAIVMEDKVGLKRNSLFDDQKNVQQDTIKNFSKKIKKIINTRIDNNFLVVSRIESLILGKSLGDALKRAKSYCDAGTDAVLIHSKQKTPSEIVQFIKRFKKTKYSHIPVFCVPSSYPSVSEKELENLGFNVVIYANQLLRTAYLNMKKTCNAILKDGSAKKVNKKISSIKEILNLIS